MAIKNAILFADVIIGPQTDLTTPANLVALTSVYAYLLILAAIVIKNRPERRD
jgi:hypothetical protein